jgi:purine-binding chemotaxis protein CheW
MAHGERQLVVFNLAEEAFGVDIAGVREIIVMQKITRVPRAPSFVEGIINLRGKVIPVIDLGRRFGLRSRDGGGTNQRIMVVELDGVSIGLVVDAVSEVLRIPADVVETPSSVITGPGVEYLEGIAKLQDRLVILLNLNRILSRQESSELVAAV